MLIVTSQPFAGFGKTFTPPRLPVSNDPRSGAGFPPAGGGYSTGDGASGGADDGTVDIVYEDGAGVLPSASTLPGWVKPVALVGVLAIAGYFVLRR